jgi:phosphate transport system substrate-binding protein
MPLHTATEKFSFVTDPSSQPLTFVVALLLFLAIIGLAFEYFVIRRKRIAYRIVHDDIAPDSEESDSSMALVEIRNEGTSRVEKRDFQECLGFTFTGRSVDDFDITDVSPKNPPKLDGRDLGKPDLARAAETVTFPEFNLGRSGFFNLRVTLQGVGGELVGDGALRYGKIVNMDRRSRIPRALRPPALLASLCLVLAGTLTGLTVAGPQTDDGQGCVAGTLEIVGSTAFKKVAEDIRDAYRAKCPNATVTVTEKGSVEAIRDLIDASPEERSSRIVASDGLDPERDQPSHRVLSERPVAIVVFAVVVNKGVVAPENGRKGVDGLSLDELRDIYQGKIADWRSFGPDQDIRLVGRHVGSGTRNSFERYVLQNGLREPEASSQFCQDQDYIPESPVIRCETGSTQELLARVDKTPGAIGYAEVSTAAQYDNVRLLNLGGMAPSASAVTRSQDPYPFWVPEHLYTYGPPKDGTLMSAFLDYMGSDTAKNIMRREGYAPCLDSDLGLNGARCRER